MVRGSQSDQTTDRKTKANVLGNILHNILILYYCMFIKHFELINTTSNYFEHFDAVHNIYYLYSS